MAPRSTIFNNIPVIDTEEAPIIVNNQGLGLLDCCIHPDFITAVEFGHHDCVINAVNHARNTDEEWDQDYLYTAIEWGTLEYIGYALERCVLDDVSIMLACASKKIEHVHYLLYGLNGGIWDKNIMRLALRFGFLECVKYAREKSVPWDEKSMWLAVYSGSVELVEYLLENGHVLYDNLMIAAMRENDDNRTRLEMVRFLHENNIPWDNKSMVHAIQRREYNLVKYAYENGCSCDENILDVCKNINFDMLVYAVEVMGCKLTGLHMEDAFTHLNEPHVRYMHEKGCPWTFNCINIAYQELKFTSSSDILEYALMNGILDPLEMRRYDEE